MEPSELNAAAAHYDRLCDRGDLELRLIDDYMSEGGECDPSNGYNICIAFESFLTPETCEEISRVMRTEGDTAAGLFIVRKIRDYCYARAEMLAGDWREW